MEPASPDVGRRRRWFFWAFALTTASYAVYAKTAYTHGGSAMGIVYGVAGSFIILVLMYYGVRKRSYKSTLGTLQDWLQAHIYLGILVFVIILFHAGFRFHDRVAVTALILLTIVVLSGVAGAILYTFIPPLLIDVESKLSAEQISDQINQIAQAMRRLAAGKSTVFQDLCAALLGMEQPRPLAGWRIMFPRRKARTGTTQTPLSSDVSYIPPAERSDLGQLLALNNQMKELRTSLIQKQRYINTMAAWLYIHVPLSFALMVVAITHVVAVFYYW